MQNGWEILPDHIFWHISFNNTVMKFVNDKLLILKKNDTAGTTLVNLKKSDIFKEADISLNILENIPKGHKVALKDHGKGDPVIKNGFVIGSCTRSIPAGSHIHFFNIK